MPTMPDLLPALQHLLTLKNLSRARLISLLDRAQHFADSGGDRGALGGTAVCTLFFEPSTRTRLSFQLAAQRLGADVLNFDAATSSTRKGETALDTMRIIEAMGVRGFVVRDTADGAVARLAEAAAPGTRLINAGDGRSDHPTQGLLDMLTLRQAKGDGFSRLKVLIVGDVKHSRVARSDLHALRILGAPEETGARNESIQIRVCAPPSLLPDDGTLDGCSVSQDLDAAIEGVDAVMMLRLQRERMKEGLIGSVDQYHRDFGLDVRRLRRANADAVVMHPGPINRGIEITDEVADGPQSLILRQVANGVSVRMAVLESLLAS
ncbi:MAG: aspartate carbamoyltransferase catalytic subunit [Pseudomonadota bacterium]|nr:aspartate carbamoyltransferase catalytic subunit [Pseudomonadota bacterium]